MRAVLVDEATKDLYLGEYHTPSPAAHELLVRVHATALNRADLLQKRGLYPPPPGASQILGLEMAGTVVAAGSAVSGWQAGARVCALLAGGGYGEYVTIPAEMAMAIPEELSFEEAAAIPEVFLTAYLALHRLGAMSAGQWVLVHAGASGVGSAAIQLIREAGAQAIVTARGEKKLEVCRALGAAAAIDAQQEDFAARVKDITKGNGANIILDCIGANYWAANIDSLALDGRLVIIGTMGGAKVDEFNLSELLRRRLQIIGTALRSRSLDFKIALTREFADYGWPRFADDRLVPVIDKVFSWQQANQAHSYMEANLNIGKIVLRID